MQERRQIECAGILRVTLLTFPQIIRPSILRFLAIAAVVCFFALPNQLAAQATQKWTGDWAGLILYASGQVPLVPPAAPFTVIEGQWIVPAALPTIDCSNPLEPVDGSSIWIGLDGWSATYKDPPQDGGHDDTDILQAGTETDTDCFDGFSHASYAYFWIQWDGLASIPVAPPQVYVAVPIGDLVYVRITVDTTTFQNATVYFEDKSPGGQTYTTTFHSGCLYYYCTPGSEVYATVFGNTAEWVVESTFYADKQHPNLPNTLDDFATTQMTQVRVTDINGIVYTPGNPGNDTNPELDWMSWTGYGDVTATGNALLACPAITDTQTITLYRAPFVISAPGDQGDLEPKPTNCDGTVQP